MCAQISGSPGEPDLGVIRPDSLAARHTGKQQGAPETVVPEISQGKFTLTAERCSPRPENLHSENVAIDRDPFLVHGLCSAV